MSNPISHQPITSSPLGHHIHRENEPLPGAQGAAPTVDYSPDNIENSKLPPSEVGDTQNFRPSERAMYSDSPLSGYTNNNDNNDTLAPVTNTRAFSGSTTEQTSGDFDGATIMKDDSPLLGYNNSSDNDNNDALAPVVPTNAFGGSTTGQNEDFDGPTDMKRDSSVSGYNDNSDDNNNSSAPATTTHTFGGSTTERSGDFNGPTITRRNEEPLMSPYDIDGQPKQSLGAAFANTSQTASLPDNTSNTASPPDCTSHTESHPDRTSTKPSIGDKIIGKTEQLAGKIAKNADLQEKGELRKQGIKNTGSEQGENADARRESQRIFN